MAEAVKCEFNQGSKVNPQSGLTEHNRLCEKPAARCRCRGELTAIIMPLCEYHRNYIANHYHWKVEIVADNPAS